MSNFVKLVLGIAFILFATGMALVYTSKVQQKAYAYCAKSGMDSTMIHGTVLCIDTKTRLVYAPE